MAHMHPVNFAAAAHGVGDGVQAVTGKTVNALDTSGNKLLYNLISNGFGMK